MLEQIAVPILNTLPKVQTIKAAEADGLVTLSVDSRLLAIS